MSAEVLKIRNNPLVWIIVIVVFFAILAALDYLTITLISLIMTVTTGAKTTQRYLYTGILTRLTDPVGLSLTLLVVALSAIITYALLSGLKRKKGTIES